MRASIACNLEMSRPRAEPAQRYMVSIDENTLTKIWYGNSPLVWFLVPLSWLYLAVSSCRSFLYRREILRATSVAAPVVVVGNVTVGGTGKTPLTIWLAKKLKERGLTPGIVSRGYRGKVGPYPVEVRPESDPVVVGDEAILLASESECIVVVHPNRVAAASKAIELGADVIIADDGLQHHQLARNCEIAVIDGHRGFGNGRLLPAGPLRERPTRLDTVDKVIVQRRAMQSSKILKRSSDRQALHFSLQPVAIRRLDRSETGDLSDFAAETVHGVAGIGNSERFFNFLESFGMVVMRHPLADHAVITAKDIQFDDDLPVVMTSKDAVKCRFPEAAKCWCVDVGVEFEGTEGDFLLELVTQKISEATVGA